MGFRPFVYRLATGLELQGTVLNDAGGVTIRAQGPAASLDSFIERLGEEAPGLARIDAIDRVAEASPSPDLTGFRIVESDHAPGERGRVTVDTATCVDCLAEMRDPTNRRFGHALINCTHCGPRYTIVCDLPYDRPLTTMAAFPMCSPCEAEYRDPENRRFHAQPTCCKECGPQLRFVDAAGRTLQGNPIAAAAERLRAGGVLAVKGLGGYHLVVDACDETAVQRLRAGKRRDHKPFAVMVADLDAARELAVLSDAAVARLCAPDRPIVLALRRAGTAIASAVAPANHRLGLMLPYTPVQHLLFDSGCGPLVMTSANESDDPLLTDDEQVRRMCGFCDGFLQHGRAIERAVDDSILVDGAAGLVPIRRARGQVPAPLPLAVPAPEPGLAVGGDLKNTVALVKGGVALLSQHLGDLSYTRAWRRFEQTNLDWQRLFQCVPAWVACDAHPGYASQQFAQRTGQRLGVPVFEIQHHHAHLAALMAEHGRSEATIGVLLDGVGYGADGQAWGGEILVGDLCAVKRFGRLRPLRLPGGDAAARETGRCALAWLFDLLGPAAASHPLAAVAMPDRTRRESVLGLLERDLRCPPSSGMGRLFDAVAALLDVCHYNEYEAMSGMRLESAAASARVCPAGADVLAVGAREDGLVEMDTRPLLTALLARGEMDEADEGAAESAWFVHDALADALWRAVRLARERTGIRTVGLSGGVFCNALLTELLVRRLERDGFDVLTPGEVPPTDGGLAYGQAAVVAARLAAQAEV